MFTPDKTTQSDSEAPSAMLHPEPMEEECAAPIEVRELVRKNYSRGKGDGGHRTDFWDINPGTPGPVRLQNWSPRVLWQQSARL